MLLHSPGYCNCLPFSLDKMQNKSDLGSVHSEGLCLCMLAFLVWVGCCGLFFILFFS